MLGTRGCRLAFTNSGIYEVQVRALLEAALEFHKEGKKLSLEILVPFVTFPGEFEFARRVITKIHKELSEQQDSMIPYKVGAMIETPYAALQVRDIAKSADFISFGTNDLTQTTIGLSRDDSAFFLKACRLEGIITQDPFSTISQKGVGELIAFAIKVARKEKPSIKISICGEQACDAASIPFYESIGVNAISCVRLDV